jgi:cytochrome c-type biogenesis protein
LSAGTLSVAFAAGVLSVLNPCGFALFPAWISRLTGDGARSYGDLLDRAVAGIRAGLVVSAGFAAVFLPLGFASGAAINRATVALPWVGVGLGVALLLSGLWLAVGRSINVRGLPRLRSVDRRGPAGLLAYGAAYATTALGCTFPTFLLAVGIQDGRASSAIGLGVVAFAAGATLVLSAIAVVVMVASATPRLGALSRGVSALTPMLLVLAGAYMTGRELRLALAAAGTSISPAIVPVAVAIGTAALIAVTEIARRAERRHRSKPTHSVPTEEISMSEQVPIACTLTAAELPKRMAEMAAVGQASLIALQTGEHFAQLRFRREADTAERLAAIVAAESGCCGFLAMRLDDEPGALRLTIEAPEGAEPVLDELVEAFAGEPQGPR